MNNKILLHEVLEEIRYWIEKMDLSKSDARLECLNRCMSLECLLNKIIFIKRIGGQDKAKLLSKIVQKAIFGESETGGNI